MASCGEPPPLAGAPLSPRRQRSDLDPEVAVDPSTPIEHWPISATGIERIRVMLQQPWVNTVDRIVSSSERKAVQTAEILASALRLPVEIRPTTGENDRSSTGFLPPEEFELAADAFFAKPHESIRGWERAVDAQRRIATALTDLLDIPSASSAGSASVESVRTADTIVVGHGGVGTLWYCHLTGIPISRSHDQPCQGSYFSVALGSRRVLHPWVPTINGEQLVPTSDPGGDQLSRWGDHTLPEVAIAVRRGARE